MTRYGPRSTTGCSARVRSVREYEARRVRIDQTRNPGTWQDLGVFEDPLHVVVTNRAGGRILVDAVKFERLT